ncbi:MAG: hypothetical protein IKL03_03415 [Bacteroidaceae bacterium]|nr:hypothetical protein [Bacteroidaceae bacterium]
MKKDYIKPEMDLILVEAELPMAVSYSEEEADPDKDIHILRYRRGTWGNLWTDE